MMAIGGRRAANWGGLWFGFDRRLVIWYDGQLAQRRQSFRQMQQLSDWDDDMDTNATLMIDVTKLAHPTNAQD